MPVWTTTPPDAQSGYPLRIIRTPSNKPIVAYVTSVDVLGCNTHYAGNRTLPCEGTETCKWCQEGYSWRWHGYLAAVLTDTLEHIIFEFTATAAGTFQNYYLLHNSMRACHFKANRPTGRQNGRVVIHCKPGDETRLRLPNPPDLQKILCHIWNIPNSAASQTRIPDRAGNFIHIDPDAKGNGKP